MKRSELKQLIKEVINEMSDDRATDWVEVDLSKLNKGLSGVIEMGVIADGKVSNEGGSYFSYEYGSIHGREPIDDDYAVDELKIVASEDVHNDQGQKILSKGEVIPEDALSEKAVSEICDGIVEREIKHWNSY